MPDASGRFKGISVPELPWQKAVQGSCSQIPGYGKLTCVNPNCKFCNAPSQLERPRS